MINSLYFASFKIAKEKKSWERLMLFKSEPILISKGWKIRAVLVTLEGFERRFLDVKAREDKKRFLETVRLLRRR